MSHETQSGKKLMIKGINRWINDISSLKTEEQNCRFINNTEDDSIITNSSIASRFWLENVGGPDRSKKSGKHWKMFSGTEICKMG